MRKNPLAVIISNLAIDIWEDDGLRFAKQKTLGSGSRLIIMYSFWHFGQKMPQRKTHRVHRGHGSCCCFNVGTIIGPTYAGRQRAINHAITGPVRQASTAQASTAAINGPLLHAIWGIVIFNQWAFDYLQFCSQVQVFDHCH
jgi:hypothetical protein